jgi:uncharacterized protein
MAAEYHSIDLARMELPPGGGARLGLDIRPGGLKLGGERYTPAGDAVPVLLEVSRTAGGHAFHLRFSASLSGPCMRCLADASVAVEVEAREVHEPGAEDEELSSPYVKGALLDVGAWAHDSLALASPAQLLCRPDCAGLCPVCGASLNDADPADHQHGSDIDPRWAKLDELRERG